MATKTREQLIQLLNNNVAQLERLGGPIDPNLLLNEKPSEQVLTRAMLEILIARLNKKIYGG